MKKMPTVCLVAGFLLTGLYLGAQQQATYKQPARGAKNAKDDMKGAYALVRQMVNNGTSDSVMQIEQLKIYTDRYMMYAHRIPNDSLAEYGIGRYTVEDGKVIEDVLFTSANGDQNSKVELQVTKTGDGYTQVINFPPDSQGVRYILTEVYKTVSKPVTTPLDGAWKQVKVTTIPKKGSITTNNNPTQFKVYQSGHFIWGNTQKDSATQKPLSYFGYGTFDMKGNEVTEQNIQSSFASTLVGQPVTLQVQLTGKDSYTQTIVWPNGDRTVEVYQRMK